MKYIIKELRYTAKTQYQGRIREEIKNYANKIKIEGEDPLVCCVWKKKFIAWYDGLVDFDNKYTMWIILGLYMIEIKCEGIYQVRVVKYTGKCWKKI